MSDSVELIFGKAIAGLISGYLDDPLDTDVEDFLRKLALEVAQEAEKVVDDADSLERESLSEQTIIDGILAQQWSQRDISPADWGTISLFYREDVQAQRLLDSIARDAALARLVAQGDAKRARSTV